MEDRTYPNLVGRSRSFLETVEFIERVAPTDAPVLIEGETGTGKEVAARAIHYRGPRRDRPFVPVNCGALPETLIENELFGHARGAFTDAREPQQGLVALASGGTLFLDEVDTLSARGQVTLLRFLQDLSYRPLGSRREERADVRIIAATNAHLDDLVKARQFRVDLFYRLQILFLRLPPLRERLGDPIVLAEHFARALSARYRVPERCIDPAAERWLDAYQWPGNVRELENLIHREFLLTSAARICIGPERLGLSPGERSPHPELRGGCHPEYEFRRAKAQAIETFERGYLSRLLAESKGNVSLAARLCGKERRAFGKLLRKYSIDRRQFASES
jgi:transcriptional regulator with GAF, ATPase, and Fis domain